MTHQQPQKIAAASPKAREGAVTRRSGPEHVEVPPIKERPAVEEEIPLEPPRYILRKDERISVAGAQSKQGTNIGPHVARTRNTAPHTDE